MKFIIAIILAFTVGQSFSEKIRYDNHRLYRLIPKNVEAFKVLKGLEQTASSNEYKFWTPVLGLSVPVDVLVSPTEIKNVEGLLATLQMEGKVLLENIQTHIDAEDAKKQESEGFDLENYHTYEEITSWLESLVKEYPDKVTLLKIGKTYEGRDLVGVKVSFDSKNENRAVFMESNIHAREWITSAANIWFLNEFLTSTNETIRGVADSHDWYFLPVVNPDGFAYTHSNDRLWRKTRVPYGQCYGADPNRNWGYKWMQGGSSNIPCSETYAGPSAFSENCTAVLSEYISTIADKLVGYIGFHSYSQLLLFPYGHTTEHLDNYDELLAIGTKAIKELSKRYGTQYVTGDIAETIYVASGSSMDWVKGSYQTPVTYTYELRDQGRYGFLLPADQILPTSLETLDSLVTILNEYKKLHPDVYA